MIVYYLIKRNAYGAIDYVEYVHSDYIEFTDDFNEKQEYLSKDALLKDLDLILAEKLFDFDVYNLEIRSCEEEDDD